MQNLLDEERMMEMAERYSDRRVLVNRKRFCFVFSSIRHFNLIFSDER